MMPKTSKKIRGAKHILSLRSLYTRDSLGRGNWTPLRKSQENGQTPQGRGNHLLGLVGNLTEAGNRSNRNDRTPSGDFKRVQGAYTGQGGKPKAGHPKNMGKFDNSLIGADTREVLVDIFDEGAILLVVAEMPGVVQEEIKLELNGGVLAFSTTGSRKYVKEILLPVAAHAEEMVMHYHNGVMAVRLHKTA